jgi:hypothetical protein
VAAGFLVAAEAVPGLAQAAVDGCLGWPVAEPPGGGQRGLLNGPGAVPVAAPVQEFRQRHRELPGAGILARGNGVTGHGQQHLVLGLEPGHRPGIAGYVFGGYPGIGLGQRDRLALREHHRARGVCRVQVMAEHPARGGLSLRVGGDELGGVGAQQVVAGEPAGLRFSQQAGPVQLGQRGPGPGRGHPGQAGGRRAGHIRARMRPEQPEHPGGRRAEPPVGAREHGPQPGGASGQLQQVQPAVRVLQLRGQRREREVRVGGRAGRGDAQRQRKPGAQPDQPLRRAALGGQPLRPQAQGQQLDRVLFTEQAERHRERPVRGDQLGHLAAAGYQRQARSAGGQQRPHLLRVLGIVRDDQHSLVRQHAAVQVGLGLRARRNLLRRHPQGVQETTDRRGRGHGLAGRLKAAQVDIELPVREPARSQVRPAEGQGGLADPGGAGDDADHPRARRAAGAAQQAVQGVKLGRPPGEKRQPRRELPRHRRLASAGRA